MTPQTLNKLPNDQIPADHRSGYVAIVGPANAGKSTLLNAMLGRKVSIVSAKQQTTRNRVLGIKNSEAGQIVFLDTPGFMARRYRGELARFIGDALSDSISDVDLMMLVIDGEKALQDKNLVKRLASSLSKRELRSPGVIVINKIDLFTRKEMLPVIGELSEVFDAAKSNVELVPVSALKSDGLDALYQVLLKRLPEGPPFFPKDAVTDQPEQFFASEVVREKTFARLHQELPYSIAVHGLGRDSRFVENSSSDSGRARVAERYCYWETRCDLKRNRNCRSY